jgi:hypothetical protein
MVADLHHWFLLGFKLVSSPRRLVGITEQWAAWEFGVGGDQPEGLSLGFLYMAKVQYLSDTRART